MNTPVKRQAVEQYKLECFHCHNTVEIVAEAPAHYCPSCGAGPLRIEWEEARAARWWGTGCQTGTSELIERVATAQLEVM